MIVIWKRNKLQDAAAAVKREEGSTLTTHDMGRTASE